MDNIEFLNKIVKKIKRNNRINNNVGFIPRQTLSVNINNQTYYISLICADNFQVQVVLLDENNNVIYKILELDGDRASIVKLTSSLYVFTDNTAYIYDVNNLRTQPTTLFLGNLSFQGICANQNNIFAYSTLKDKIIKYDENLLPVQEYDNPYSKDNLRISINLACNGNELFSIPIMVASGEQYVLMKKIMEQNVGYEKACQNDQVHSCSFNTSENTLYLSMYDLIWVIKDGIEFSYLHFKNMAITTAFYDNDIKKLIVNFGGTKGDHVIGSIIKLSDSDIKEKAIPLNNLNQTLGYAKNLIADGVNEIGTKRNR